ncbi:MAG: NADH-quinone oxidoreductase subunit F [Dehalococcoidia bacterium]|nr:NADH-quinone oxidoreductase subunit F [Dehalococcoidia bacterium]MCB9484071.1 NADH-quinone oxidoreductase subunit F [Dehalococcoidia bacterium]MCB9490530.1 NADH-quinone oxidoreductase subunit F [Dehalococcoidia bacterium]
MPESDIALQKYDALRERADAEYAAWRNPERPRIDIAMDTSSLANGARATGIAIHRVISERNAAVDMGQVHGYGMQWIHPSVQITFPNGETVLYGPVRPEDAGRIVDEATGTWGAAADIRIGMITGTHEGVPSIRDHEFFSLEPRERRLMRNLGLTDPDNLLHYIARDGYRATARMLGRHLSEEAVRNQLNDAGLTGRGGANFPTGVKWNFLFGAAGDEHYMVCNADEGDPGAWVNRVVMEGDPHLLIEGMLIGGYATKAKVGFIYLRDEYPFSVERMERAIKEAEAAGILGDDVLGTGMEFRLRVVRGAGAYVCGEETGLLSSIQDSRGMPRVKPPFPAQRGVFNKPSNVNNVESFANVPLIIQHNSEWYREHGSDKASGTKIFSFSGDIPRVGFMEVPFATRLEDCLRVCGGIQGGQLKAIQSGGPLGSLLPPEALPKLILQPDSFSPWDAIMGGGGMVFMNDQTSVLVMTEALAAFVEEESCGRCTTCHGGNQRQTEIIRRIIDGEGRREDDPNLALIDRTVQFSNCVHGQFSPKITRNTRVHFKNDFEAALLGVDPTLTLKGMYEVYVAHQRPEEQAAAAADICPTAAIQGEPGRRRVIDEACIRCGACFDVAPEVMGKRAKAPKPGLVPLA